MWSLSIRSPFPTAQRGRDATAATTFTRRCCMCDEWLSRHMHFPFCQELSTVGQGLHGLDAMA